MGQSHSSPADRQVPIEVLSHELALRFASKCYTALEIAHFKDNFKRLADHQDDIEYWKEETLCKFLCIPEPIRVGSILSTMCTYIGAFPFPSQAPCILTREAMLKVVTIMTGRYKKVLKRGNHDRIKLLFRSLAVFDRRSSVTSIPDKPDMEQIIAEQKPDDMPADEAGLKTMRSEGAGFAIDQPMNQDEEEDDDDLALAALESLDAIEVFNHDQKIDRKVHHATIPADHLKSLFMLILLLDDIKPLSNIASYSEDLDDTKVKSLEESAAAMLAAFDPDPDNNGITYTNFVNTITTSMPEIFEPLGALFEHFLFSKNIDLSRHKGRPETSLGFETARQSQIYETQEDLGGTSIFNDTVLAQIASTLRITTPSSTTSNIFASGARFNQLYSTTSHGTSLSSFSRQVTSWDGATFLIVNGTIDNNQSTPVSLAAYLPFPWKDSTNSSSHPSVPSLSSDPSAPKASLIQLKPRHAIFPGNPYNKSIPLSYFSTKTGIALGCVVPPSSRTSSAPGHPILGPVSLLIDADIATATLQHDGDAGAGAFVTDPGLERAQQQQNKSSSSRRSSSASHTHRPHASTSQQTYTQPKNVTFDVDSLEIWGISFPDLSGDKDDEITRQKKKLAWEEAEAARRRGVNFGGDKDGARALLEMAGLVGDKAGNRSGGSV